MSEQRKSLALHPHLRFDPAMPDRLPQERDKDGPVGAAVPDTGVPDALADDRHRAIEGRTDIETDRVAHAVAQMARNAAYRHAAARNGGDPGGHLLEDFRDRFRRYRRDWRGLPQQAVREGLHGEAFRRLRQPPLSVDIEVAAVCDLACPFCYRQWVVTPDKIMDEEVCRGLIDQCAALGVPSIKLNWRGEPLLHPRLPELVDHAKRAGILEVIINTNAVTLDERRSRALIDAGLDLMIYSFDGATKASYERMRVGRFAENRFEDVLANIRRFAAIRDEMGAVFPRTRIQMILTEETFAERDRFFDLFRGVVDDVSVKAYTERGGRLADLDPAVRARYARALARRGIPEDAAFWRSLDGRLYVGTARLPCEQPFQRLMIGYDGRVSPCCYDWGQEHVVGYADARVLAEGDAAYHQVRDRIAAGAAGFEAMAGAVLPTLHTAPDPEVRSLDQIWNGSLINELRQSHCEGRGGDAAICRACQFKETYEWMEIEGDGQDG